MLNNSSSCLKKEFQIVHCDEINIATRVKDDLTILMARLMREQQAKHKRDVEMRLALVQLKKKVRNLEQQLNERQVEDEYEDDQDQEQENDLKCDSFFQELLEYGTKSAQGRRYSIYLWICFANLGSFVLNVKESVPNPQASPSFSQPRMSEVALWSDFVHNQMHVDRSRPSQRARIERGSEV